MLALDENRTIRTNILNLSVFIESYILDHLSTTLSETHLIIKDDETKKICQISPTNFTFNNIMASSQKEEGGGGSVTEQ